MKKLLLVVVVALMASPAQLSAKTKKKNKGVDTTLVSKLKIDDWSRAVKGARKMDGMFPVYLDATIFWPIALHRRAIHTIM